MKIPYGLANFAAIREEGYFYVDKTPFLPLLESRESGYTSLLFLRPRRMGKSALVTMLAHYYDIHRAPEFDALFRGLWVHDHPTPEKNRYLVLHLNFSTVSGEGDREALRRSFLTSVQGSIRTLVMRYRDRIPDLAGLDDDLKSTDDGAGLLSDLLSIVAGTRDKLYVLIDEYDTFANDLLSSGEEDLYSAVTGKAGFVRSFYRTLKAGTETGAIGRIFVTGASPILLDDLYTGFNIVTNISQHAQFNTLAGFTRADVERALEELLADRPDLATVPGLSWGPAAPRASGGPSAPDQRTAVLGVLEQYYDGYRFSPRATERIFNSDMVLYFLRELAVQGEYPQQMLDPNARTDYHKLHQVWAGTGTSPAERRLVLERILDEGHVWARLIEQFGRRGPSSSDQVVSLLYYTGMLTLSVEPQSGREIRFDIPNRVIRELAWEHFAALLKEQEGVELDQHPIRAGLRTMAVDGAIEPFVEAFHRQVVKAMGVKDLRQFSEKTLKMMLMTTVVLTDVFNVLSEKEFAQGYCDLFLSPTNLVPGARFAWMLELKYLHAAAKPDEIEAAFVQASEQLRRYASDAALLPIVTRGHELRAGAMVFLSSKEVLYRELKPGDGAQAAR